MEGETTTSIETSLQLFHQRVLPSLDNNILCGNSLIAPDFEGLGLTPKEERKINVFDWKDSFKDIFKTNGGFDAVIGNPPYGANLFAEKYIREKYPYSSQMKEINSYLYFTEKAINLLKISGLLGYIIPDTFLLKKQYYGFRNFLISNTKIVEIVETGSVFEQAKATPNVLLLFENAKTKLCTFKRKQLNFNQSVNEILNDLNDRKWASESSFTYEDWLKSYALQLGRFTNFNQVNIINKLLNKEMCFSLKELKNTVINRGLEGGKADLNQKKTKNSNSILIPDNIFEYYIEKEPIHFTEQDNHSFNFDRILIIRIRSPKIKKRIIAALETEKRATLKTLQQIYFDGESDYDLKFILAILNSKLINFYCSHYLVDDLNKDYLSNIPIVRLDFKKDTNNELYNKVISNVSKILNLYNELKELKNPQHQDNLKRKIKYAEEEINKFVYQMYDISEEEMITIENHNA